VKCPVCKVDTVLGFAIEPKLKDANDRVMELNKVLNVTELKLINVEKCPKCGYSNDGM
jgi:predicted Zn-ribbon and HTH transcriptional regulator